MNLSKKVFEVDQVLNGVVPNGCFALINAKVRVPANVQFGKPVVLRVLLLDSSNLLKLRFQDQVPPTSTVDS